MSDENTAVVEEEEAPLADGDTRINASVEVNGAKLTASFDYAFGATAEDAIASWGTDVVLERFIRACKIEAQARIRELLKAGKDAAEVAEHMSDTWHPGAAAANAETSLMAKFADMTAEQRQEWIDKLAARSAELG